MKHLPIFGARIYECYPIIPPDQKIKGPILDNEKGLVERLLKAWLYVDCVKIAVCSIGLISIPKANVPRNDGSLDFMIPAEPVCGILLSLSIGARS